MILAALVLSQAKPLWDVRSPKLKLDYRIEVSGQATWSADEPLEYQVSRRYSGTIVLDRREDSTAWDFNFDTTQTNPSLIQTTAAKVSIVDTLKTKCTWSAEHEARRVMTEATVELAPDRKSYRLFFGIGDTLGATDAVNLSDQGKASTMGLTQIPNFRTAKDEFRSCVVTLPKLGRAEFTKAWPVVALTQGGAKLENNTIRVVLSVKLTAVR